LRLLKALGFFDSSANIRINGGLVNNQDNKTRAERLGLWIGSSRFGASITLKKVRVSIFLFVLFTHSIYWLTAWWSPWPFLILSFLGLWFAQGFYKPWTTIMSQAIQPEWDSALLKITIPFIVLNYIAIFACLYMFGSVTENTVQISGTWKHFYFSAITLTTVGFGNIVPNDFWSELIATVQAIIGFMGFAVLAGIVASIALKRIEISNKT
jgi:hypothetical protein